MKCIKCKTENQRGVNFCVKCGTDLKEQIEFCGIDSEHYKDSTDEDFELMVYPIEGMLCNDGLVDHINGHRFVDLGLSVKWSAANLGANAPQAFGSYYAWGETKVKDSYKLSNSIAAGLEVDCIKGNKEYDAARLEWGGTWRMPTIEEIMELRRVCSWVRCVYKGVYGVKITGPSGGRIFLPAAGYRLEESLRGAGDVAYYWTSTPEKDEGNGRAKMLHFDGNRHKIGKCNRLAGLVIRPVAE